MAVDRALGQVVWSACSATNATMPFVVDLATRGVHDAVAHNPGLKLGVNVAAGEVTYAPVADAVGIPHAEVENALAQVPAAASAA